MTISLRALYKKEFGYLLLVLAAIAGSLFVIFTFLATVEVSEAMGVVLFLVVAGLLMGGYMAGLMILAWVVFTLPARRMGKPTEQQQTKSTG
jgi:ABC-type multidrug transport system permease subunit